jgi:two-component system sensor histidine kinase EvgS
MVEANNKKFFYPSALFIRLWRSFFCCVLLLGYGVLSAHAQDPSARTLIRSAAEINYPPFSIVDANNQADGFSVELLRAALDAVGSDVEFAVGAWEEVKQSLIDGKIQVLPLVGRTPEREQFFDFTFPYMTMHGTIVVRATTDNINSLADLEGKNVAVMSGDNAEEFVERIDLDANITATATFDDALQRLSRGEFDAVVIQKLLALQLIRLYDIDNIKLVVNPLKDFVQSFCFAVHKGDAKLLSLLNEGLSIVVSDGTFERLHRKWFATLDNIFQRPIIIGGKSDYPPFEYLDANKQPAGYHVALTQAIARHLGLTVKIELGSWERIRNRVVDNEIDLVLGMSHSAQRAQDFSFSTAYAQISQVIVTRKNMPIPVNIADLENKSVVVRAGDIMYDFALKSGMSQNLTLVATQERALQLLTTGEVDYALMAKIPALYWIEKNHLVNLKVGEKALITSDYCFASSTSNRQLVALFSHGLAELKANGQYGQIRQKWLGPFEEQWVDQETLNKWLLYTALSLLVIMVVGYTWTRTLKIQLRLKTSDLLGEINEREKIEAQLRRSEELHRSLYEQAPFPYQSLDKNGHILTVNKTWLDTLGYTADEVVGHWYGDFLDAGGEKIFRENFPTLMECGMVQNVPFRLRHKQGHYVDILLEGRSGYTSTGEFIKTYCIFRDITAEKKAEDHRLVLEKQLSQKYKMEAIGLLAGGMAHNFNNNLSVILGNLELIELKSSPTPETQMFLKDAKVSVLRSRELIQNILSYSRNAEQQNEPCVLHSVIQETQKLLRSTLPTTIDLVYNTIPGGETLTIMANATRIQEILFNLCNNAVQAMDEKGTLTICLDEVELKPEDIDARYVDCVAGDFVRLRVSDTGSGMSPEVMEKIFDPFFTTKDVDKGTGMGLATVQGVVQQLGGQIKVFSTINSGTTFEMYFPALENSTQEFTMVNIDKTVPPGTERILFVDDDEMIVLLGERMLTTIGYQVISMTDSIEALKLFSANADAIDLIISDQTMPGLSGTELIEKVLKIKPDMPCILCTGYSTKTSAGDAKNIGVKAFMLKPFEQYELAQTIRKVLDA